MAAKKETVYFVNEEELGEGWLANDPENMIEWLDAFLGNLEDDEPVTVKFVKRKMTRKEINDLPEA